MEQQLRLQREAHNKKRAEELKCNIIRLKEDSHLFIIYIMNFFFNSTTTI